MSAVEIGRLIGLLFSSAFGLLFVLGIVTTLFLWPLALWSVVRNVRGIRVQLERLNDTLERRGADRPGGILGV